MLKYIKHLVIFLVILILTCLYNVSLAKETSFDTEKTIILGGDNYFPPYEYVDKNGVYKGFNVDIMRAIAIETGVDIEIRPMPWFEAILSLSEGRIDAIEGMKYSPSRNYFFEFSNPYLVSAQAIFVNSDNKYIINIEDLEGKKVAIQQNDIAMDSLQNFINIELIETENQQIAIKKLAEGEVQAFVGNRQTGLYIVQKNGYRDAIKIVGEEILPSDYGIAVTHENSYLLAIFNDGLDKIKKNGTYDKIYKKWFGEPIAFPNLISKKILYIAIVSFMLSLLIIFVFYRWNYILKKEVEKRTKALARESMFKEQTLNSIFSTLLTIDNEGCILSANEKVKPFIDHPIEDLIGEHFSRTLVKEYFHEDDFYEVIKTRKGKMNVEKILLRDEEKRVYEYNMYPLFFSNNNVYGITLTFKETTREKLMKEQLIRQDKMESLGRLVAGIAHEIRNPLTAIQTYIELIPYKFENIEFRKKISEDVPNEIERLNALITNLLDYSKPREPKKELVNIHELIEDTVRFFNNHLSMKGISLILHIEKEAYIYVDKHQAKQIIINLLLNAIQAVESHSNPKIIIYTQMDHPFVSIVIKDNGCGIANDNINRIFDPFFTTKDSGTGLGLSISYQFIKENDGVVHVESNPDFGTVIYMKFPSVLKERSAANEYVANN